MKILGGHVVVLCMRQLFYRTHIIGFLGFMVFGFAHHVSLWAYTLPGKAWS